MAKVKRNKVTFEVDGQEVRGDIFRSKRKKGNFPAVIFLHERDHGRKENKERAKELVRNGLAAFTFDFRGHGDSEGILGKQTLRDGLKDARGAYDALAEFDNINESKIGVAGRGFGGYLATLLAQDKKVKSMTLSSPAIYKDEWMDLMYRNFPLKDVKRFRSQINFVEIKSIQAIRKFTGNLLVLGNEEDEVVPETVVRAYYDNAINAKKREIDFIEGAEHEFDEEEHEEKFMEFITDWFKKTL